MEGQQCRWGTPLVNCFHALPPTTHLHTRNSCNNTAKTMASHGNGTIVHTRGRRRVSADTR